MSVLGSEPPHVAEHIAEHVITWPVRKLAQSVCELQPCPQDQSITNHHRCNDCYLIQPSLCRINSQAAQNRVASVGRDEAAIASDCTPRFYLELVRPASPRKPRWHCINGGRSYESAYPYADSMLT
jgi:hypothetical protein